MLECTENVPAKAPRYGTEFLLLMYVYIYMYIVDDEESESGVKIKELLRPGAKI